MFAELVDAVRTGDVLRSSILLRDPSVREQINKPTDGPRWPLLSLATLNKDITTLQLLIDAGADVNGESRPSILKLACNTGDLNCLAYLLDEGLHMDMASVSHASFETLRLLLSRGADIYTENPNNSPLVSACYLGHDATVDLLLNNYKHMIVNMLDEALLTACLECYHGSSKLLIEHGANPNYIGKEGTTPLICVSKKRGVSNTSQIYMADLLLEYGADIYTKDSRNMTALDWAEEAGNLSLHYYLKENIK